MYLLKTTSKENPDYVVEIGIKGKYHEFDYIEDLIAFIYKNASFINSYKIYEAKEFSTRPDSNVTSHENSMSVDIDSIKSVSRFE